MKRVALVGMLSISLAGCGGPKSTAIPSDPSKWDTIAPSIQKLSDDDRKELTTYLMRVSMGSALTGGKGAIPPGMTIGSAIADQKHFENDQKIEEAKASALKAKLAAEHDAKVAKLRSVVEVVLTNITILPVNYDANRYSARIALLIGVANHSAKDITGIKGVLVFKDQFNADITRINLSLDEDVKANSSRSISGYGKDLNQFEASDVRIANTPLAKMHVTFEPSVINYSDGTSLNAPDGDISS